MIHKFKNLNHNSEFKHPYSKTEGKYASAIKRFLENIYTIDPLGIKISYYKRRSKTERNKPPKMTSSDLYRAYNELMTNFQFQDALIINLMYSLAIDPYVLYTLTYEGINNDGEIKYWDYKQKTFVCKQLHKELRNDIQYSSISLIIAINLIIIKLQLRKWELIRLFPYGFVCSPEHEQNSSYDSEKSEYWRLTKPFRINDSYCKYSAVCYFSFNSFYIMF